VEPRLYFHSGGVFPVWRDLLVAIDGWEEQGRNVQEE